MTLNAFVLVIILHFLINGNVVRGGDTHSSSTTASWFHTNRTSDRLAHTINTDGGSMHGSSLSGSRVYRNCHNHGNLSEYQCAHGGTCVRVKYRNSFVWRCRCPFKYDCGTYCRWQNPCFYSSETARPTCHNFGKCICIVPSTNTGLPTAKCSCMWGFTGETCNKWSDKHPCIASNPCPRGLNCSTLHNGKSKSSLRVFCVNGTRPLEYGLAFAKKQVRTTKSRKRKLETSTFLPTAGLDELSPIGENPFAAPPRRRPGHSTFHGNLAASTSAAPSQQVLQQGERRAQQFVGSQSYALGAIDAYRAYYMMQAYLIRQNLLQNHTNGFVARPRRQLVPRVRQADSAVAAPTTTRIGINFSAEFNSDHVRGRDFAQELAQSMKDNFVEFDLSGTFELDPNSIQVTEAYSAAKTTDGSQSNSTIVYSIFGASAALLVLCVVFLVIMLRRGKPPQLRGISLNHAPQQGSAALTQGKFRRKWSTSSALNR